MKVEKVDLSKITSVGIGGTVELFKLYSQSDLESFLSRYRRFYILGGGTNVLPCENITDPVLRLLGDFLRLEVKRIDDKDFLLRVGAAVPLSRFLKEVYELSIEGLEGLWGIPGTVGGAVSGNAGAYGVEISGFVSALEGYMLDEISSPRESPIEVRFVEFVRLNREEIEFYYRGSSLNNVIITNIEFRLSSREAPETSSGRARVKAIWEKALSYFLDRKQKQPLLEKSFGSCFKNPEGDFAGRLIDSLGLKGYRIGGAKVSEIHANFLVNVGEATFGDFIELISFLKEKVKEAYGVNLEEEVKIWWGGCKG